MSVYRHVYVYVCIYTYIYICARGYTDFYETYIIYICARGYTQISMKLCSKKFSEERSTKRG